MTISLETELTGTAYDHKRGNCSYTISRGGKKWTVTLHISSFKGVQEARRKFIQNALEAAMLGPSDEEKSLQSAPNEKAAGNGNAAWEKLASKEAVNYREGSQEKSCGSCVSFSIHFVCSKVDGDVLPTALCNLYEAKRP